MTTVQKLSGWERSLDNTSVEQTQPVLFIGHGSPMNALYDNNFTRGLAKIGSELATPKAIMVVSAHWLTRGTYVATTTKPETIYDFGGFPEELFQVKYPASGSPEMAKQTIKETTSVKILEDAEWGLDHGAWTVLKHMFPMANIPVYQLSIDYTQPAQYHYELGKHLAGLRKKGVLIIGSGNIVHNLSQINFNLSANPFDWALEFDSWSKEKLLSYSFNDLINYTNLGKVAQLAVPTNDHYLPMLYCIGMKQPNDSLKMLYEEIQHGSISMRCFKIG
ncbi:MAG: 4,5-DOPA dioxygenase extradiol [Bacteroidetes bacterium]|nr:4,5-DOPA dioxygenase extradiol [Bacteroidota bacterium]